MKRKWVVGRCCIVAVFLCTQAILVVSMLDYPFESSNLQLNAMIPSSKEFLTNPNDENNTILPLSDGMTNVSVSPASQTINGGLEFSVAIVCEPGQPVRGFEFNIEFDPTLIQATQVTEGTIFSGFSTFFNAGAIDNDNGAISAIYGLIIGSGNATSAGNCVNIDFVALNNKGTSPITLLNVGVTNETAYIPIAITNGSATVMVDDPVVLSSEQPADNSIDISLTQSNVEISIIDPEASLIDWTIEGAYVQNTGNTQVAGGVKSASLLTPLPTNTVISWYVNATDGNSWTRERYQFTTEAINEPNGPLGFSATAFNSTAIDLSWTPGSGADTTLIERNTQESWSRGQGTFVFNSSGSNYRDSGLTTNNQYFYQAWSFNVTIRLFSITVARANATLSSGNQPPSFSQIQPAYNANNVPTSQASVQVTITDPENQPINWTIEGTYIQNTGQTLDSNGIKTANCLTPLPNDTTIIWYINATDGLISSQAVYQFTTSSSQFNTPPSFLGETPSNNSQNILISTSSLQIMISDAESDPLDWSIETTPSIGSASGAGETNGVKSCPIQGLTYGASYLWYVNASDGTNWTREVYQFTIEAESQDNNFAVTQVYPEPGATEVELQPVCRVHVRNTRNAQMTVSFYEDTSGTWRLQYQQQNVSSGSIVSWNRYVNANFYDTTYSWKLIIVDDVGNTLERIYSFTTSSDYDLLYVGSNYTSSIEGWQTTYFDSITDAIEYVQKDTTIFVDAGTYEEQLIIDKPLQLRSMNAEKPVIIDNSSEYSCIIRSDEVTIDGFSINGIQLKGFDECQLMNCNISERERGVLIEDSIDSRIEGMNIEDSMIALSLQNVVSCTISHCHFSNNTEGIRGTYCEESSFLSNAFLQNHYGIFFEGSQTNSIQENTFFDNEYGFYSAVSSKNHILNNTLTSNTIGIHFGNSDENLIQGNTIRDHSEKGIYLEYGISNDIIQNFIIDCTTGLYSSSSRDNTIFDNYFDNPTNAWDTGANKWYRQPIIQGTNIINGPLIAGNYWEDYAGVDLDGDGIGDTQLPYQSSSFIVKGGDLHPLTTMKVNKAPERPLRPLGATNGKTDTLYQYYTTTTDPEDNLIFYQWDLGNGITTEWVGPYESEEICETLLTWLSKGQYQLRVRARDEYGAMSDWSEHLIISMPYQKDLNMIDIIVDRISERFPFFEPWLDVLRTLFS